MKSQDNTTQKINSTKKTMPMYLVVILVSAVGIAVLLVQIPQKDKKDEKEPQLTYSEIQKEAPSNPTPPSQPKRINMMELKTKIQTIIEENIQNEEKWIYGIVITDLTTNETVNINENEIFKAASIGKIPILLTIYNRIKQGRIKESDAITITAQDLQDYGTGVLRYEKTPQTLTIRELAELMMKKSDNTAAYVLATKAGQNNIKQLVAEIGMHNTDTQENTITPQDSDLLLKYLYNLKYSDPTNAGKITKIMTNSDFENRLPTYIPKNIIIAHKIGTATAQVHDVGIVLLEKRPYTISVFSKNITDETRAEKNIAKISKVTYDFFESLAN